MSKSPSFDIRTFGPARSIKVRAWHRCLQRTISAAELGEDQLTLSVDGRGFVNVSSASTKLSEFYTNMEPQLSAGRYDGTGEEIYEGDILELPDGSLYAIRWKEPGLVAVGAFGNELAPQHWGKCTVVGEVHRDPSLLESIA